MGPGQKFRPESGWVSFLLLGLGRDRSAIFGLGLGLKIFPYESQNFHFFPFG